MLKWLLVGMALPVLACGEAAPAHPTGPATFELGTGSWRFEPLVDGQDVELVHGAQGGWHMWISLRVTGAEVDHAKVHLTMESSDARLAPQEATVELPFDAPDEHGARKLIGYTGIVNDPSCWVDALVRVEASLTSDDGKVLSDEREVMLRGGVYPPPPCAAP